MIKPNLTHIETLTEFNKELRLRQDVAHNDTYTLNHDAIRKWGKGCEVMKEIGVCQGGTFSTMLMMRPKKLIGQDIAYRYYQPYEKLFKKYADENNVEFKYKEMDSHNKDTVDECDFLHIDSHHTPEHLIEELKIHAPHVRKFIQFHDTANYEGSKGLLEVIAHYITYIDQSWQIVEHNPNGVGYTVIQRIVRTPSHRE
jgi:hypothetical protein